MTTRLARLSMTSTPNLPDGLIDAMCRYSEGLLSEQQIRKRYRLSDATWEALGADDRLIEQIEAQKLKRERLGLTARERAQRAFSSAPVVLSGILNDPSAPARSRIESAKELRVVAANGPEAAPATDEKFHITIVLSADEKIHIDKQRGKVDPHDGEIIDHAPQDLLAIAAANKRTDDGNGNPI